MSIYLPTNPYHGVNAHLHSYFQGQGGWSSFHTNFIAALARDLNAQLPSGYLVDIEQSLQIREFHPDSGERIRRPEPDLTIYRTSEAAIFSGAGSTVAARVQPIPETVDLSEDDYYSALVIYSVEPDTLLGRAVTRIELLSPTNKQGEGYQQYRGKRYASLKSRVTLIEIDFLHETPPVVKGLPRYPAHPDSHAYLITVSDPVPSFEMGEARTIGFGVDVPIPLITVPLGEGGFILLDLNSTYDDVFTSLAAYSRRADYSELPMHIERYNADDQMRIRACMARAAASVTPPPV